MKKVLATSAAIIVIIIALIGVVSVGEEVYWRYLKGHDCNYGICSTSWVSRGIYFHNTWDGKGYVYNKRTGEKLIKNIAWIAKPTDREDTLVCFSDGKKRGYFSKNTGRVVIEPRYDHAWIFSEGLASVEEDGYVKFIDGTGRVVIDKMMPYSPRIDGYVFHDGYCVVDSEDGMLHGLMDKTGNMVLPLEYSYIEPICELEMWRIDKGNQHGLIDKDLNTVIPLTECSMWINAGTVQMTMPDHTLRKYSLTGELIDDFYISGVRSLAYEKDEILYRTRTHDDYGEEYAVPFVEEYHPRSNARMRAYVAGDGYEGLMTTNGHVITMPLYKDIEAIGPDLYLCEVSCGDKVIINGKGETVR